jgi:hypothetical protein
VTSSRESFGALRTQAEYAGFQLLRSRRGVETCHERPFGLSVLDNDSKCIEGERTVTLNRAADGKRSERTLAPLASGLGAPTLTGRHRDHWPEPFNDGPQVSGTHLLRSTLAARVSGATKGDRKRYVSDRLAASVNRDAVAESTESPPHVPDPCTDRRRPSDHGTTVTRRARERTGAL